MFTFIVLLFAALLAVALVAIVVLMIGLPFLSLLLLFGDIVIFGWIAYLIVKSTGKKKRKS